MTNSYNIAEIGFLCLLNDMNIKLADISNCVKELEPLHEMQEQACLVIMNDTVQLKGAINELMSLFDKSGYSLQARNCSQLENS